MENVTCLVCGLEIEGSANQKTGRPVQFHKECRELNNAISLLQSRLNTFREMNPTADGKKKIRSALWSLANSMNGK